MTIRLLESLLKTLPINRRKLFTTGQSMGGMMSMYFMTQFPELFAAGMFVDCHWDPKTYDKLLDDKFIFFAAGKDGSAGIFLQVQKYNCDSCFRFPAEIKVADFLPDAGKILR